MSRVVIYGRVSTNDQTTDNQIYKLKQIIENRNWNLVDTYKDETLVRSIQIYRFWFMFLRLALDCEDNGIQRYKDI